MKAETKQKIVVVGSINMDLVAYAPRIPVEGETILGSRFEVHPGGKGANQAVAAGRLGWPVQMIGRVGDDAFGSALRRSLEEAGVDTSSVATSKGSSGVAVIVVSNRGENCIVISPGANALVTPEDLETNRALLQSAGIVLAQLEIPLATVEYLAELCASERVPLILDPAPAQRLPAGLLSKVTWFTPNNIEADFYLEADRGLARDPGLTAEALGRGGAGGVVLKLGSRGAFVRTASGKGTLVGSFPVKAVDTTAAGDAFNGAFATALLMGLPPEEAARFAAAAAAISVTRAGAQPSMASLLEVETMLRTKGRDQSAIEKQTRDEGV